MKELCVVHLVRAHNGIEPFRCFLESYRANPGGIEHDLLIVFKGFGEPQDTEEYRELLVPFRYATLDVSDEGFDITAYFAAFKRYSKQYRYFCFLNSYSVILDRDWVRRLHENISKPGVGLVGVTGSWQSHNSNAYAWFYRIAAILRAKIIRLLPFMMNRVNTEMGHSPHEVHKSRPYWETAIFIVKEAWVKIHYIIYFDPFPNYHIRSNAFMISSELMKTLKCPSVRTKMDAHRFESGRNGLTRQILGMGKRVIVVGKDGIGYEKEDWHKSRTFWPSEQENLLVADNQTRYYQEASPETRICSPYIHPSQHITAFQETATK